MIKILPLLIKWNSRLFKFLHRVKPVKEQPRKIEKKPKKPMFDGRHHSKQQFEKKKKAKKLAHHNRMKNRE
jgi:hypothetical protein